jgi:hypothetical protein
MCVLGVRLLSVRCGSHFSHSLQCTCAFNSTGYGNWPTNGENGGRYFSTASFVWEATGTPGGVEPWAPWPGMYAGWKRMVTNLEAVGAQIAAGDVSVELLASDRPWLATPVVDPIVNGLCAKVRLSLKCLWWLEVVRARTTCPLPPPLPRACSH